MSIRVALVGRKDMGDAEEAINVELFWIENEGWTVLSVQMAYQFDAESGPWHLATITYQMPDDPEPAS